MFRHLVLAGALVTMTIAAAGCGDHVTAVPAVESRSMTDYLLTTSDTPDITYALPWGNAVIQAGIAGMYAKEDSPPCRARNAAIELLTNDPFAGAIQRVLSIGERRDGDTQIAVLNRVVDPVALLEAMQACSTWSRLSSIKNGVTKVDFVGETLSRKDIPGVGLVFELPAMRYVSTGPDNFYPRACLLRFATVGNRTVVEYLFGNTLDFTISTDTLAFGDRLLIAQVGKLRVA
ncbi:hypothetical protein [Nocardia sp. NPDC056100]|uniref:hypothetical protein n=1 Tax=Nocardia sp. NPDC056100 TaxID=3345712 RepID=UPI0035DE70C0